MTQYRDNNEGFFCSFTFGQFVSLAVLEIAALFFIFYLGARYGPGLMGWNTKSANTVAVFPDELEDSPVKPTSETPELEFTYPEKLTEKEKIPQTIVQKKELTKAIQEKKSELKPAAESIAETDPVAQIIQKDNFSIQVGSYKSAEGAGDKILYWKERGYDAYLSIGEIAGKGTWYRVRIGRFVSRQDAQDYLEVLSDKEKVSGIIVKAST
jgi:cell division septation protein DedD